MGQRSSPVLVALVLAAIALAAFVFRQVTLSRDVAPGEPTTDIRLFSIGSFRNGNIATLIIGLGEFGIVAVLPLWLQFASALFFYGIGVGFATAQVTNVVLAEVPEVSAGQGSGVQSVFRQLGSALGIAVLTTTFFSVLGTRLSAELTTCGLPARQVDRLTHAVVGSAGAAIDGLAAQPQTVAVTDAARAAMAHGISLGGYLAAGFLLAGLLATLLITTAKPQEALAPAV
jgi:hypothetical protein